MDYCKIFDRSRAPELPSTMLGKAEDQIVYTKKILRRQNTFYVNVISKLAFLTQVFTETESIAKKTHIELDDKTQIEIFFE